MFTIELDTHIYSSLHAAVLHTNRVLVWGKKRSEPFIRYKIFFSKDPAEKIAQSNTYKFKNELIQICFDRFIQLIPFKLIKQKS